jgi:ssDNA-binding Zn-finger/Zn-ribbon topoisomerase 1
LPMPTDEEVKLVGKCPDCGNAMSVRKSKKGKVYYSCTGYPTCKFMSWDIPTGDKCPVCQSAVIQTPRGNVKCSNKDCDYKVKTEKKTTKNSAPTFQEEYDAPPLLEEPIYDSYD